MVKSCVAVGCANRSKKGSKLSFYRFPADVDRRQKWIAAVKRKSWQPSEYSWICSAHFISGRKSDDSLSPDYVPSVFEHVPSPEKRRKVRDLKAYCRRKKVRASRLRNSRIEKDSEAATSLHEMSDSQHTVAIQTEPVSTNCVETQTDVSAQLLSQYQQNCQFLQTEKSYLKTTKETAIPDSFQERLITAGIRAFDFYYPGTTANAINISIWAGS